MPVFVSDRSICLMKKWFIQIYLYSTLFPFGIHQIVDITFKHINLIETGFNITKIPTLSLNEDNK